MKKWSGQVGSGWILGRFGGSGLPTGLPTGLCGSWVSGHWVVGVMSFQKTYGLYGLIHHIVEISGDVTDAGRTNERTNKQGKIGLLIQWKLDG